MRKTEDGMSWVVYRMTLHGKPSEMNAVCEQGEWEAMELAQPGHHTLVRSGITTEAEAEQLARSRYTGLDVKKKAAEINIPRH
jgi:hypothetical protein